MEDEGEAMARTVREIMNPEVFGVRPEEEPDPTLEALLAFGITAAPVLDEERRPLGVISLRDLLPKSERSLRMTSPAETVLETASIPDAGRALAAANVHHLVVVDAFGRTVGMVSALDVVRGLLGAPTPHPMTFPHLDQELGVSWTDDRELVRERVVFAPNAPGVLVLREGGAGITDSTVWAESCENLRARLDELLEVPQTETPLLSRILQRQGLRFRVALIAERAARERVVAALEQRIAHLPPPHARALGPIAHEEVRR
jgi:CBS domain-containing protein